MSVHFFHEQELETEVNVTVGFCRGLALAVVSPKLCPLLPSLASILSRSNPRSGSVLKQRFDENFNSVLVFMRILHEFSCRFEASCILCKNVASVVLVVYQEYRRIVLVRQASNPHLVFG